MDETTAATDGGQGSLAEHPALPFREDTVPLPVQAGSSHFRCLLAPITPINWREAYKIKTAFGSDLLFSAALTPRQGTMLTHLTRWYANSEILKMATSVNGELLALSGPRNPYPGKLGVVEESALADLLLVDGNPIEDIQLIADPVKSLLIIMKNGRIYKNVLSDGGRCSDRS